MLYFCSQIFSFDRKKSKGSSQAVQRNLCSWKPTQQFGVTIEWINANQHATIPPIMTKCIDFLSHPDCLETEGIFRSAMTPYVELC